MSEKTKRRSGERWMNLRKMYRREKQFWFIALFCLIWVAVFSYYPMYGLVIAYQPGMGFLSGPFMGFEYFKQFFTSVEFPLIMRNTFAISGLNILIGFPAPILFAILLNELGTKWYKRTVQTVSYLPHFVSWVVVASLIFSLLGNEGLINELLLKFGWIDNPINFMGTGKYFWGIITAANVWKGIGWSAIMYISAMAGVDDELYQAGAVDGLGRFGMIWNITLPSIAPTILILLILQIGSVLNAGFEQQLLLGNDLTRRYWDVIDTYSYRYGLGLGRFSFATAVGLMKSIVSVILVFSANALGKKVLGSTVL